MEIPNHQPHEWVDQQVSSILNVEWTPNPARGLAHLRARQAEARRRTSYAAWAGVGILASGAALMTYPTTRAYAHRCMQACVAQTARFSQLVFSEPVVDGRTVAPDFQLTDANGHVVQLSALHGKVVLLNFWATWCTPCRIEIPWFIELQKAYRDQGLAVVGVSLDDDGWTAVRPFLESRGVNYQIAVAGNELAASYGGLDSLPTTLLIDRNGRVAATHVGLVSKSTYEKEIRSLLLEK